MPFNIDLFEHDLKQAFDQIKKDQSEALSIQISVNFTAGISAAANHKSIKSGDPQEEGLTETEKAEITLLVATYIGYISEFNDRAQEQVLNRVREIYQAGGGPFGIPEETVQEIKQYLDDVLSGKENIVIDNTGQERKEIYLDKNLNLSEVTRTVEKPFYSSVNSYVALMGANVSHTTYEKGRKSYYQNQGFNKWVFVGPADERARPWHVALLGEVFIYGTTRSEYAERCLQEPRCRHRGNIYYGDERDVPAEKWQQLKDKNGLYWDEENKKWAMKGPEKVPTTPNQPKKETPVKEVKKKEVKPVKKVEKTKEKKTVPREEPVKRTPEEVKKEVKDHEKEIKDYKVEHGAVFSTNGDLLIKKVGQVDHITWTREEREVMQGTILTHNHPNNAGFSPEDISFACRNGLKEMRAVGSTRSYSMHLTDGRDFTNDDWDKLESTFEKNYRIGVAKERIKYKNNPSTDKKWDADKATEHVANYAWSRTVKEIDGLTYKVEVVK
jgi:hypothetical protein